jgi:beta-N-acetylhexosaminidase
MRNIISLFLFLTFFLNGFANKTLPPFLNVPSKWADSLMATMSIEQKIGQLIMVTTYPSQGDSNERLMKKWIADYHIGGVLFLKSTPHELASGANRYQAMAKIPLYIALDAENGLSFRLDSVVRYPHAMGLGSLNSDSLIYHMGREIGQQCRELGINLNFAPVADVNANPENPVINYRSFGENPGRVAQKAWQLAKGMQDQRVLVTAKHFPGHGDTAFDSHHTLPTIDRSYSLLDSVDFLPFRTCIDMGINGIMTAHINMSVIDKTGLPATLSEKIMTGVLRDSLGFKGLVFSDGMNMKGITMHFTEGEAAVKALKAGVDVIEFVLNPDIVIKSVLQAIQNGEITEALINEKCRKVLLSKKWLGLDRYKAAQLNGISTRINKPEYQLTARRLYEQSITVAQNSNDLIPLQRLDTLRIATLSIGKNEMTPFQQRLQQYMDMDHFVIPLNASQTEINKVLSVFKNYNLVIAGVHGTRLTSGNNYAVTALHRQAVNQISKQPNAIVAIFGNPYSLKQYTEIDKSKSVLITYGENNWSMDYAAQLIFGALNNQSTLPVSVNNNYPEGSGIVIKKNGRLKYTIPEEEGFDSHKLNKAIDSLVNKGIREKAFPGCQVLVAKNGKVVYHESYGFHTYENTAPLENDHLYDWASITKVTGPLPLLMKLTEDKTINLNSPISDYWPDFIGTNKELITLREVLTHQAGLRPGLLFHAEVMKQNHEYRKSLLRERPSHRFPVRISTNLYLHKDYKQNIFNSIKDSDLLTHKRYVYSDLGFLLFPELITRVTGTDYESFYQQQFILPIGASSVNYNPYRFNPIEKFVPTESDLTFRKELLQGFVHDESAALLGGVSGNAGLFGTTNDLAKIMQCYLQKGSYGDFTLVQPKTFEQFTRVQYPDKENRRALGFDKPLIDNARKELKSSFPAPAVSPESYGHTGFTGTFAWNDPKNQMIVIIMTNRVYPTRENPRMAQMNFRSTLQQTIYKLQNSYKATNY